MTLPVGTEFRFTVSVTMQRHTAVWFAPLAIDELLNAVLDDDALDGAGPVDPLTRSHE